MLEGEDTRGGWKSSARGSVSRGAFPGSQVQLEGPHFHLRVLGLLEVGATTKLAWLPTDGGPAQGQG